MIQSLHKFGDFELDCNRYELLRSGRNIRLENIPMELLILLVTKNGNLVTRQEIIDRLWGKDVFVDTEHGINTAVRKIRQALKDDPEQPRFVQTIPGKGYRFIAERTNGGDTPRAAAAPEIIEVSESKEELTVARRKSWQWVAIAAVGICVLAGAILALNLDGLRDRIFGANQIRPIHSLAVLPLANLSGDTSQDYYADGMTDELITALAQNRSLRVVSRTSAMQYKGVNKPSRQIAQALGVDGILEGSVSRSTNHLHMNLQLIYAPTDTHVWAQSYDRDLNDAYSLPSEVSLMIAKAAKLPNALARPQRYINPEAHDAYLRARYLWFNMAENKVNRQYFEKAIQLQPDYAAAWGGLADSYIGDVAEGKVPPEPSLQKGAEAARKAVELDNSSAEAHDAMAASYLFGSWDWRSAEKESLRAIELDPNLAQAHHLHSYILIVSQRPDDALREEKRAMEIDPFAEPWALGNTYINLRQFDTAINELRLRELAQANDSLVHFLLSKAYWLKGMWKESQHDFEEGLRLTGRPDAAAVAHRAFEQGGEKAVEEWNVQDTLARATKHYVTPWDEASACAYLGDKEQSIKFLEDSFRERDAWLVFIQNDPIFDFLHSDERYRNIVKRMGLPPAY